MDHPRNKFGCFSKPRIEKDEVETIRERSKVMFTKEEIETAIKVINEFAGTPDVGVIAELVKDIRKSSDAPTKEVRVTEAKETR